MLTLSSVCLGIVMILCVLGTFSSRYRDNLAQRVGMFCVFIGLWPKFFAYLNYHPALAAQVDTPSLFFVGLALYGTGTAFGVWRGREAAK